MADQPGNGTLKFQGVQGRLSPLAGAGQRPAEMACFYVRRFAQQICAARQICAPQGHALGGRTPDMHRVFFTQTPRKEFKCACPAIASSGVDGARKIR